MVVPPWFQPMLPNNPAVNNPNWTMSANGGASYVAMPGLPTQEYIGPNGTQRFRQFVTIPPGTVGTLCITVQGDVFAGGVNDPAQPVWDGSSLGNVIDPGGSRYGPATFCVPAVPGAHTFELRIGASAIGGLTNPQIDADLSDRVPCDCCPAGPSRCVVIAGTPTVVFSCRTPDGDVRWYTLGGTLVPDATVASSPPC